MAVDEERRGRGEQTHIKFSISDEKAVSRYLNEKKEGEWQTTHTLFQKTRNSSIDDSCCCF